MKLMQRTWTRITVAIILLTCLVCPLVELFDTWDHTIQTGNDTEYTVVLLALCVGVVYSLARLIVMVSRSLSSTGFISTFSCIEGSLLFLIGFLASAPGPGSPPLNLRI
jgi:hypothetical protein